MDATANKPRKIIHIDMDCFYAAVEVKFNPSLRGKPIAVGGPANSRGVLTTASYEARKFGCRSAMASATAVRLCPQLIIVRPNFERYKAESRAVHQIFTRFTSVIEPLSLDEAYLDVTDCEMFGGSATLIAREIRSLIKRETGLTASAGIAPNKFLAKIASDWNKPDGQCVIRPEDIDAFMPSLEINKIHGVGKVTARKMNEHGIRTCGDLQKHPVEQLVRWFGARGIDLRNLAFGIDLREVKSSRERKSLSVETTFGKDLHSLQECLKHLPDLYEDWEKSIRKSGKVDCIRGIVVKLKFTDFKTTTHEMSTKNWPRQEDFASLLAKAWERREEPVRLVGIGARLAAHNVSKHRDQLSFDL